MVCSSYVLAWTEWRRLPSGEFVHLDMPLKNSRGRDGFPQNSVTFGLGM